ncbi:transporter substrate-binding domain-containing protein [Simiduia curdlanivorans]|uniref:Substrate-binding periplasmic protein n=1 Tax=Simiduia curdlanivorans TaxID=1492769 RepID=A0ABV8V692_9GAMM|nr:transporter substrate-binding domain-containing protein [Simiduia curdlanivorans]MDN3638737.1 transporter substrate-binding domain-containing protein [Simiduia curdlanivorans]
MCRPVVWLFSLALLLAAGGGWAEGADKKSIVIGMGNFEPYFIAESETGIFTDLINAVFVHMPDYRPVYKFGFGNTALWASYEAGRIDAVTNLFDLIQLEGCRTDPVFLYRDVAITTAINAPSIESVADLAGLSIVTFQGASKFLGPEFTSVISADRYSETEKPELQARMLMGGRYDVSVGDLLIFLDARKKLRARSAANDADFPIVVHDIFPQILARMGFRNQALCDAFNSGLEKIKASGEYSEIYRRYYQEYNFTPIEH